MNCVFWTVWLSETFIFLIDRYALRGTTGWKWLFADLWNIFLRLYYITLLSYTICSSSKACVFFAKIDVSFSIKNFLFSSFQKLQLCKKRLYKQIKITMSSTELSAAESSFQTYVPFSRTQNYEKHSALRALFSLWSSQEVWDLKSVWGHWSFSDPSKNKCNWQKVAQNPCKDYERSCLPLF